MREDPLEWTKERVQLRAAHLGIKMQQSIRGVPDDVVSYPFRVLTGVHVLLDVVPGVNEESTLARTEDLKGGVHAVERMGEATRRARTVCHVEHDVQSSEGSTVVRVREALWNAEPRNAAVRA